MNQTALCSSKSLLVSIPYITTNTLPTPYFPSYFVFSFILITSPAKKCHILLSALCKTNSMVDRDYDLFCLLLFLSLLQEAVARTRDFICWITSPACTTYYLCHLRKVIDLWKPQSLQLKNEDINSNYCVVFYWK